MAKFTPAELAEKWQRRLSSSLPDIERGVRNVTVSPTQLAAAKQQKMLQRLTEAVQSGKWANGLKSVSLEQWREATITKGLNRIPVGAEQGRGKMEQFAAKLIPYQETLKGQINNMPDLTLQDSIARMTAWVNGMAKFKK